MIRTADAAGGSAAAGNDSGVAAAGTETDTDPPPF